jgi:cholest-4-en-3-one 26-monooxygenase
LKAQDTQHVDLHVDLTDPDLFQSGDPLATFKLLQREAPVYWNDGKLDRFWALTKYADVVHVSKNADIFSSAQGTIIGLEPEGSMLSMDNPRHKKLRSLVEKGFTARLVRDLEPHTREVTSAIFDELDEPSGDGDVDFVDRISAELPLRVIVEMLGTPREDARFLKELGDRMVGNADPDYNPASAGAEHTARPSEEQAGEAQMEMFNYFKSLATERQKNPGDDLVSVLLNAELDGEKFDELDFLIFCMLLVIAGNETTRNLITGGMLLLFDNPDEMKRLQSDPSLMPTTVEEMLRLTTSVMHFERTATRDTELRGQAIAEGEKVCMWYVAANRDAEVFTDADRFDVGRQPNPHLAFGGGGPHFCLGASLARQEIRALFEELTVRYPGIQQTGPAERLRSNFIRGIKALPVKLGPRGG